MSVAALGTREEKLKLLFRPVHWASTLSFFGAVFGFVYWHFGMFDDRTLAFALCVALGLNAALLLWAVARVNNAARR